jgi:CHASE2 domain-containing sensor protein
VKSSHDPNITAESLMSQLVILNFGTGNCQQGFSCVTALVWEADNRTPMKWTGSLPPAPELPRLYREWRSQYNALQCRSRQARRHQNQWVLEFEEDEPTNVSEAEFQHLCEQFKIHLNQWLDSSSFQKIERQLRTKLAPSQEIRLILETEDDCLRHLPWHLWHFLEDYALAEMALSTAEYDRVQSQRHPAPKQARILAILGNAEGIDVNHDRTILEQLPKAETVFLVEPQRAELDRWLWDEGGWDILFFAGHSFSLSGEVGEIEINRRESLTISQLRHALKAAIARGLQLAIFNSCDGLGLARQLADLHLPQLIVMREPVPDRVAQTFLTDFLSAYARGKSFYVATREAKERLQGLEADFPCACWLPIICQNPTATPPNWQDLVGLPLEVRSQPLNRRQLNYKQVFVASVAVALAVFGVREMGALQSLELKTFDLLLRLRPQEELDSRFLIVTVTGADVQGQNPEERRGSSLSNRTLAQLLDKLAIHHPRVVVLDIYRDFPVEAEHQGLIQRWQNDDRLLAACKVADDVENPGIAPPPGIQEGDLAARVGFTDVVSDRDGILRRQLLGLAPPRHSLCQSSTSLSLLAALRYLEDEGISAQLLDNGDLQVGKVVLKTLRDSSGGYRHGDMRGYQMMLNYRAAPNLAPQVTLQEILSDRVDPQLIRDRLIVVGTTDRSFGDLHSTPYGLNQAGVVIQAHAISQIISAVKEGRSLIWWWPWWGELLWMGAWSLAGGIIVGLGSKDAVAIGLTGMVVVVLWGGCATLFWQTGAWLPLLPAVFSVVIASGTVLIYSRQPKKS